MVRHLLKIYMDKVGKKLQSEHGKRCLVMHNYCILCPVTSECKVSKYLTNTLFFFQKIILTGLHELVWRQKYKT